MTIDSKGDVWVADQNNERVQEFNQGGEYIGKFGAAGAGAGQFALGYPVGIATDSSGDVWVTDSGNNRVEKWVVPGYSTPGGPTFLRAFGYVGTGNGQFNGPAGVAVDPKGNLWVSEHGANRLQKFSENGEYLTKAGSTGTGNGQFNGALEIASDAKGDIWVADVGNNRIEEFSEAGAFLSAFGTKGSAAGLLSEPNGVAVSRGDIWVADSGNNRIEEFSEAGKFIRAIGSYGSGSGQFNRPIDIAATPEGNLWVTDSGNYRLVELSEVGKVLRQIGSAGSTVAHFRGLAGITVDSKGDVWAVDQGNNNVQEFNSVGEYIAQLGSAGTAPGALSSPWQIATSPSGHVVVADYNNNRIEEWTRQSTHSQISTEVTVDGRRVDAGEASCSAETCPIQREWSLESSTWSPGSHAVAIKATDGLGNTTTKTINVEIARDTTKPALEVGGELAQAPEGWVEQESYGIHATTTDAGSGVTSLIFRIDGKTVATTTQPCNEGGCGAAFAQQVKMNEYTGGAHEAEVVAIDGAGNSSTKRWTINVDPEGHITTAEAKATLEAVDNTSPVNTVGPAKPEEEYEGTAEGLGLMQQASGEIEATGTNVPMRVSTNPTNGYELEVVAPLPFQTVCGKQGGEESGSLPCTTQAHLEEEAKREEEEVKKGEKRAGLQPITITPVSISLEAGSTMTAGPASTVATNTAVAADTVTRPLSDGGLNFEVIRDASAPEHYAFEMNLSPELELRQVNTETVAVYYKEGFLSFTISAEPAHDAIGSTVPTHLSVSGPKQITLTVEHRGTSPAGGGFVYPVIGGAGWQGGWRVVEVPLDEPPPAPEEQAEEGEEGTAAAAEEVYISAPEPSTPQEAGITDLALLKAAKNDTSRHIFRMIRCYHRFEPAPYEALANLANLCGNPFTGEPAIEEEAFNFGISGTFYEAPGKFVSHRGGSSTNVHCAQQLFPSHTDGVFLEVKYAIREDRCLWWGTTGAGNGGSEARLGHHICPFGEWTGYEGGTPVQLGSALYIISTSGGYVTERHKTVTKQC